MDDSFIDICVSIYLTCRKLRGQVVSSGLEDYVLFNKSFIPDEELWDRLRSADVYINSYVDEVASVSGM